MKRKPKANITVKLALALLPTLLVILFFYGHRSSMIYRETLTEQISSQLQMQVDSAASQIASTLSEINRSSLYAYSDMDLRDGLAKAVIKPEQFTVADRLSLYSDVIDPMFQTINSPSRFSLMLYPLSAKVFCDYRLVFPIASLPEELPAEEMLENGYARTFYHTAYLEDYTVEPLPVLSICRVLYHSDGTPLGILCAHVRVSSLENALSAILPEEDSYWYRCELPDGEVIFESGARTEDMLILSSTVSGPRAVLTFGVNYGVIDQQLNRQRGVLSLLALVVLVVASVFIVLISSLVMLRLRRVLDKYRRLRPGQELSEPALEGEDEAALLDQTFSQLYRSYYESSRIRQQLEENQRLLETNLLLSRINPHFLYNTLSAIRWKLPVEYWEVVDKLVAFYREMLSKGRDITFLGNELSLMRKYVDLQRFTYSKEILYTEEVQPGLDLLILPKFLLQPVFENAVRHGAVEEVIQIRLKAAQEGDRLILIIENSGDPIDAEAMDHLNSLNDLKEDPLLTYRFNPDDRYGYGVFNIITRLRLIFGDGYGLWYERPAEGGTRARFVLPVCAHPEDVQNWKKSK